MSQRENTNYFDSIPTDMIINKILPFLEKKELDILWKINKFFRNTLINDHVFHKYHIFLGTESQSKVFFKALISFKDYAIWEQLDQQKPDSFNVKLSENLSNKNLESSESKTLLLAVKKNCQEHFYHNIKSLKKLFFSSDLVEAKQFNCEEKKKASNEPLNFSDLVSDQKRLNENHYNSKKWFIFSFLLALNSDFLKSKKWLDVNYLELFDKKIQIKFVNELRSLLLKMGYNFFLSEEKGNIVEIMKQIVLTSVRYSLHILLDFLLRIGIGNWYLKEKILLISDTYSETHPLSLALNQKNITAYRIFLKYAPILFNISHQILGSSYYYFPLADFIVHNELNMLQALLPDLKAAGKMDLFAMVDSSGKNVAHKAVGFRPYDSDMPSRVQFVWKISPTLFGVKDQSGQTPWDKLKINRDQAKDILGSLYIPASPYLPKEENESEVKLSQHYPNRLFMHKPRQSNLLVNNLSSESSSQCTIL